MKEFVSMDHMNTYADISQDSTITGRPREPHGFKEQISIYQRMEKHQISNEARASGFNHSRQGQASLGFSYPPSASRVPRTEAHGLHLRLDKA